MNDPDHGQRPSVSGGQATGGPARPKRSRRRKGKAKRAQGPSGGSLSPGNDSSHSGLETRPQSVTKDGDAVRKRKRRRRGKGGGQANTPAPAEAGSPAPAVSERSGQGHSSRPPHHQRGLQGRPLKSSERPPEVVGPSLKSVPSSIARQPVPPTAGRNGGQPSTVSGTRGEPNDTSLYAALDLGTNNCRLLIAQPTRPGQFRVVDAFSRIVRLGEGLAASGRLSDEAMDRSVEALKICAGKLKSRNIRRSRLIATEACRRAENGEAFLNRVRSETGLELEIINRETEARLAVSGCSSLVGREAKSVVLFDIGGGSSEIAVIRIGENRSSRLANHITHWTSLPVGVVTLSERHGGRDVTPESFAAMVREVEAMLADFDCAAHGAHAPEDFHLIGTSGTVTTLAGVHLDLPRYDRRQVDGVWLSDAEVTAMQARLLSWDFSARAANPCIGPDRADLVLAGCAILEAIRNRWPSTRMRVADRGLREGLLTDMMADDGVWRRGRHRRPNRGQSGRSEGREK
ncbi:exopolyphosphatase/guanosine-5'-triphosphate,3'-diphosphate pyrophosphatase [Mycoplana sp. BE70]|uniref:Ppx/GppA phosphatase family protein n=1 Tax=Mycoplana sp. BE70 TaxID=2817775 RepID=UPI0028551E29|nr:exopolyphosphatase [Mycoplana sp. BE70]MDR6756281.1 exopolyphosphatase/guanosine-5'-triphosphate,3'-diphosphate pyrophosphatase [Mycoplana sp. BE70]